MIQNEYDGLLLQIFQRSSRTVPTRHRMTGGATTLTSHPTPPMRGCERNPGEVSRNDVIPTYTLVFKYSEKSG